MVTVKSINKSMFGNVASINVSYTLLNPTNGLLDEATFKLFYASGGGLPQYGFFWLLLPGESIS